MEERLARNRRLLRLLAATASIVAFGMAGFALSAGLFGFGDREIGPFQQLGACLALMGGASCVIAAIRPPVLSWLWRPALASLFFLALTTVSFGLLHPAIRLDPFFILILIDLPGLAILLALAFLTLPFVARVNLAVFLALLTMTELAFSWLPGIFFPKPAETGPVAPTQVGGSYYAGYFRFDPVLGYRGSPNTVATAFMRQGVNDIYDIVYTLDEFGWRNPPRHSSGPAGSGFVAFFGDSFTIGQGVADNETMPAQLEAARPGWHGYNLGFHGYGPQQMLAILETLPHEMSIRERRGHAVFTFIDGHIERLIGSMRIHNTWGHHMPFYRLDEDGEVRRKGDFTSGRPFLAFAIPLLSHSALANFFGFDPVRIERGNGYLLAAKLFAKACRLFAQRYESLGCHVVIYPAADTASKELAPLLRQEGISVLDYSGLYSKSDFDQFRIAGEGHPNAAGHRIVVEHLIADLGLE